jgi:hypothetical protein
VATPAVSGAALVSEIDALAEQAGYKYVYGGTTSSGYDCSGLIYAALEAEGYHSPPRTSEAQYAWTSRVTEQQLQTGDLVFAQFPGDNASPGHVGVYIGNGNVYSAQDPALGIGVSPLASWGSNIVGYGQIPDVTTSGAAGTSGGNILTSTASGTVTAVLSAFGITPASIGDLLERGGLMIAGIALVFLGVKVFTSESMLWPSLRMLKTFTRFLPTQVSALTRRPVSSGTYKLNRVATPRRWSLTSLVGEGLYSGLLSRLTLAW